MADVIPALDIDPFSDELLADPYAYYHVLRDVGPVFSLPKYATLGIARFDPGPVRRRQHRGVQPCRPAQRARLPGTAPHQRALRHHPRIEEGRHAAGSIGWDILDAHERGEIPKLSSFVLLWNFLGPAFDTTINAIGTIIWLLATHPDQWAVLRSDPGLIPATIKEGIRVESPLQVWSRVARAGLTIDDVAVPDGTRVAVFIGAANRDEHHYDWPSDFVIARNPVDQLGFGNGIHTCVGAPFARLELTSVLKALANRTTTLEPDGDPVLRLNNTTRGFFSAPVRVGSSQHGCLGHQPNDRKFSY